MVASLSRARLIAASCRVRFPLPFRPAASQRRTNDEARCEPQRLRSGERGYEQERGYCTELTPNLVSWKPFTTLRSALPF